MSKSALSEVVKLLNDFMIEKQNSPQCQAERLVRAQKLKTYTVVRTVVERFEVVAYSKQEAAENCQDPFDVVTKSERVFLSY